jgi:hypothetical protein
MLAQNRTCAFKTNERSFKMKEGSEIRYLAHILEVSGSTSGI